MSKRVLIVDDMREWLNFHQESFKLFYDDGFLLDLAKSANEAVAKVLENEPYDLIITDLEMEEVLESSCAGAWLLKRLEKEVKCKNTAFLVISASYNIKQIADEANADYIAKTDLLNNRQSFIYKINSII